jgi:hypothetical protein
VLITALLLAISPAGAFSWSVTLRASSNAEAQAHAAPSAPTGVSASCVASNQKLVTVFWNAVTAASSYTIYKSATVAGSYTSTASGVTGTSWTSGDLDDRKRLLQGGDIHRHEVGECSVGCQSRDDYQQHRLYSALSPGPGKVKPLEPSDVKRIARPHDELVVARAERDLCLVRLRQAEVDRDKLRADLAEALGQVEYWRTLAEYRERRLVERQEQP